MNRTLILLALAPAAAGCQNTTWNNPYGAFGPATIPPAGMQTPPQNGYYQPPPATTTLPAGTPGAVQPSFSAAPKLGSSGSSISKPAIRSVPATEEPIRIVEAAPKTNTKSTSNSQAPSSAAPSSPALDRTRGYQPAQPAGASPSAAPTNRTMSAPAVRRDSDIQPASFAETAQAPDGQWKAR